MMIVPSPPKLTGTPEEQLTLLNRYVTELAEYLSIALNNINISSFDEETRKQIQAKGG